VNGDTVASLVGLSCSTTATSASQLSGNPYKSTCSGASDSDYSITYAPGTVNVNPATLTITASSGSMTYGGTPPPITPSYNGFVNGDGPGSLTTAPTCFSGATTSSPAGSYISTCSGAADSNYNIGYVTGMIMVTPATASVVVVSSVNPSTFGGSVYFTATVSSAAGTPTGTVQFLIDGVNFVSSASLSGATATSPATTTLTPGEHVVTAVYSGDTNFLSRTSAFLIQVVNNPLVSIAVTPANPSILVGGTEQFAATGTFTDTSSAILPTGGTWALGNTMTNGVRAPMAAAGGNGLLYYFGGQDAGGEENYVQTYNPATGAWNTVTSTPAMTARYQGVAVAPGNGLIYVIGGWNNSLPTSVVEAYDPVGNTWTSKASLGHPSGCSVGGAINGLIYVLTGCDSNSGSSNEFDVYNPATNTWTSLSSPAHAHNSGAGGVVGGKFYVAGGYDVSTATGITEVYDPQTSTWTTVSSIPAQLGELGGSIFGGNLYVVGGLDNSSNPQPDVYVYNAQSNTWSTLSSSLSAGRRDIGVVAFDGLLYAAGGYTSSTSNALEVLDIDDVTWSSDTAAVATVDPNAGLATGVTPGTANIKAASTVYSPVSGSTLLTVNKQNQTINFGPLSNVTYGVAPFAISATDSASLQVTFTSTTTPVCTASGGTLSGNTTTATVTILAAGTCSITASQAGNSSYNAASNVSQSFTVNPATLTITAKSTSKNYGQTVTFAGTEFTTSGLVSPDTVTSVTLTSAGAAATATVGSSPYNIAPSAAVGTGLGNYNTNYVNGSLAVTATALTITAKSTSKTYGQTVTFAGTEFTISGLVNSDSVTSVTLTSAGAAATAAVGSSPYNIVPSAAVGTALGNYNINYVNGSLSVTAAALTVTASSGTMTYGGTVPTISPSYSGFVNGQGSSVVTGTTCSTTATASSPVGSYPSSCTGATAANYTITPVNGSVSVTAAALTVTASSGSMTYGGTVPAITASYSGFVNGDSSTSLTGQPTCTTTATSSSAAGSYPSSCTGAVDPNYTISYTAGSVTVGKAPLTITASSGSMTYGGTPPSVTPSYSAFARTDTAASLTTAPSCTTTAISSTPVGTDTGANTCAGAVDGNYTISYVPGNVTVGKASLTITASSGTMTYGGTPPTITASYGGFVNGDTSASLTTGPTCSTTATSHSSPGTYTSNCTGAVDANYTIGYGSGTVVVSAAPLTITASSATMTQGGTVPTITPSYSGFVNGDSAASLTTAPTCSTTATSQSAAGSYPSSCAGAVDSNYTISYVNGTVTDVAGGGGNGNGCVYALGPTVPIGISISGVNYTAKCGAVINSDTSTALSASGSNISAPSFAMVGGDSVGGSNTGKTVFVTGIKPVSDPLAYLPVPPVSKSCSGTSDSISGQIGVTVTPGNNCYNVSVNGSINVTFNPGQYSSITISGSTGVTFNPGLYIIVGSGGLNFGGTNVSATGVTFYLGPNAGAVTATGSNSSFAAPTTGTYAGILFFQDRSNTKAATIGGSNAAVVGSLYFPKAQLTYKGSNATSAYTILVADSIVFSGSNSTLNNNYSTLSGGSPL
jgi:hypothetical protein